jgi:hypothetical protein
MKLPNRKKQHKSARKAARQRPFAQKESYKWVEAITELDKQVGASTQVIHVFDREGDISEVFEQVRQLKHTGVLVRAAHNRSLDKIANVSGTRWSQSRFVLHKRAMFRTRLIVKGEKQTSSAILPG